MTEPRAGRTPIEPQALPGGLRLRSAALADVEQIADLTAIHHVPDGVDRPDEDLRGWVRDLLTTPHPQTSLGDCLVVDDPGTGRIAAKLIVLSQRWTYDGIPFERGRVEFVTTAPEHRGRGLIRILMDRFHRLSADRGQAVQVISGIPHYYRRFGYEYALPGTPFRRVDHDALAGSVAPGAFRFRRADAGDLPLFTALAREGGRRWLVTDDAGIVDWRRELEGRSASNPWRPILTVIERDGRRVGAIYTWGALFGGTLWTHWAELVDGVPWDAVGPELLHELGRIGAELHGQGRHTALDGPDATFSGVGVALADGHPLLPAVEGLLRPMRTRPALYLRVADVPGFLRLIGPALERRLAASADRAGHTGDLRVSFIAGGLTMRLDDGRLAGVEPWRGLRTSGNDALFPGLTFLQLLFGYRSMTELEHAFPDCRALNDRTFALLETLFPKRPSSVWPFF